MFLLEIIASADERLGTGAAEMIGAVAGAALALFVPFAQGFLLRGVIGSAIGSLVGKKIAQHDPAWFRKRLELALDRFDEINRFHREKRCTRRARRRPAPARRAARPSQRASGSGMGCMPATPDPVGALPETTSEPDETETPRTAAHETPSMGAEPGSPGRPG